MKIEVGDVKIFERRLRPNLETKPWRAANILVVDDDVDSALLVGQIFSHLGCQTTCSLNSLEAHKQICAGKADIIVLDWCLDHHIEANRVLGQCIRTFEKFGGRGHKSNLITYSSLLPSEIEVQKSPYFDYLDHWQKPISRHELLLRVLALLAKTEQGG